MADYRWMEYIDGQLVPVCLTQANSLWSALFFLMIISLFFLLPLAVLIVLYAVIARHLMADPGTNGSGGDNHRARRQVVLMLGTVVLSFFLCLLPFRVFTLWIIVVPRETVYRLGVERYYNILYFSRIMLYLNSAINPILYNLMSSKFRHGFRRLCGLRRRRGNLLLLRHTATLTTTLSQSSTRAQAARASPDLSWRTASVDSRVPICPSRNGSIRRNIIIRTSLINKTYKNPGDIPDQPESYV